MKKIKNELFFPSILFFMIVPVAFAQHGQNDPILVGRISYVEGQLLRYVPEEKEWVVTVRDAPFGLEDVLYAGEGVNAELIMPNNTWLRISDNTQIQLIKLEDDVTDVDVKSGIARFYNKSSKATLKAATPFGYVVAPSYAIFDLYVGNESVEVIALKETVTFVHGSRGAQYEVLPGSSSILADSTQVTSGRGIVNAAWDDWNDAQDRVWKNRMAKKGTSSKYLPSSIEDDAYVLEENGSWDRVYYDGAYRYLWRPTCVGAGWAPYTVGRWTVWYGDHCWIPYEAFGYVTHHYGSWVYVNSCNCWYWAPPVSYLTYSTGPYMGCFWYPGRVSWFYSGFYVGWIPLAPWETYYCNRYWGPSSVVVNNINITNSYVDDDKHGKHHKHRDHVIVVKQHQLYTVNNYNKIMIKDRFKADIIKNARAIPVLNERIIKNYAEIKQKYNFNNDQVVKKPRQEMIEMLRNQERAKPSIRAESGKTIKQQLAAYRKAEPARGAAIKPPLIKQDVARTEGIKRPYDITKQPQERFLQPGSIKTDETERIKHKGRFMVIPSPKTTQDTQNAESNEPAGEIRSGRQDIRKSRALPAPPQSEQPAVGSSNLGRDTRARELPKPPQYERGIQPEVERETGHYRRSLPGTLPSQTRGVKDGGTSESSTKGHRDIEVVPRSVTPRIEQDPTDRQPAQTHSRTQPQRMPQGQTR